MHFRKRHGCFFRIPPISMNSRNQIPEAEKRLTPKKQGYKPKIILLNARKGSCPPYEFMVMEHARAQRREANPHGRKSRAVDLSLRLMLLLDIFEKKIQNPSNLGTYHSFRGKNSPSRTRAMESEHLLSESEKALTWKFVKRWTRSTKNTRLACGGSSESAALSF